MYLMFSFTIKLGRVFKPFFNDHAQALFVDGMAHFLTFSDSPQWLAIILIVQGVGNGIREVAAFIPILGFLYLFISVLEESGYMARATFVMDRFMRVLGLPGKAFVPMILGFGCNVPAMLATRTLERPRDRLLSILLNPFMTCGAQLAVFTLFAAVLFPDNGKMVVFMLYLIGIGFVVLTALLLKSTFLKEEFSLVMMEIPNYHIPKLKNVLINTWTRVKAFVVRVGKIIITMAVLLNVLSSLGTDGSFKATNIEHSVLIAAGRSVMPVLTPMGLKKLFGAQPVHPQTSQDPFVVALHAHFKGAFGAFAYLLFILLYFPCIATSAAAYRESGRSWSLFMVVWATGLAYLTAILFYQLATFADHPANSAAWLLGITAFTATVTSVYRHWGKRRQPV